MIHKEEHVFKSLVSSSCSISIKVFFSISKRTVDLLHSRLRQLGRSSKIPSDNRRHERRLGSSSTFVGRQSFRRRGLERRRPGLRMLRHLLREHRAANRFCGREVPTHALFVYCACSCLGLIAALFKCQKCDYITHFRLHNILHS
jgi:hypothetical protein